MPAPPQSSARTASLRNVLLLEEYDALAVAIGSALKKFAPGHTTSVARTLADAEKLAAKIEPELFVIDVDPPWPGLTEFLEKIRTAHPEARALVIGAAIPAEIAAERGSFGALQFINKPFELAAFGAAVQAVLGPWRESESAIPRGSLRGLGAIDVLLLHCAAGANVIVDVRARPKQSGKIHIAEGQISHAETGGLTGADALREILSWPESRASEEPLISPRRTVHGWATVFIEALREATPTQPPVVLPKEEPPVPKPRVKTGKKIVVIDDTEMLLIFVEDVLATANPELQITTALTGTDGIKEVARVIPDLVLLDYSLPDLNGDEVCRRLLENARTARVPILMMSGHVLEMTATAARFENVVATIEKPFLSDALVQLVQKTLAAGPAAARAMKKSVPPPLPETIAPPKEAPSVPQDRQPAVSKPSPVITTAPAPEELKVLKVPEAPAVPMMRVATSGANDAVLGLFLEVASMQLTPQLQMGAIRAKPASLVVSLHLPSAARNAIGAETGFQLGAAELDGNGHIASVHLTPTSKPFQPSQTRNAFEIGGVSVIPNHTRTRVQLTPAGTTPMTMELLVHLELGSVELSPTFQVAQLILKWRTNTVRITLNPKAPEQTGAMFEVTAVQLDNSGRIAELLLNPKR